MKSNELSLNRLTEGQSVPRPHFGDASIVFDSDGVFKYIDGNDGAMKLIYPPNNLLFVYPEAKLSLSGSSFGPSFGAPDSYGSIVDFTTVGPYLYNYSGNNITGITTFNGVNFLTRLQNAGTSSAINISSMGLSAAIINKFFTDLPPTTKTATIDARFNTGSAACDPTIATAKGYIVNR